ncbi:rhomboid family intramembrane serine protease [Terrihabitans sp. B22-R8]|uniref:rhomboid family intramembrane serine protease n=1 Tax=Terrihabitans sp. B22-R8 TaxID=3425128 RepID=UPI00403C5D56
MERPSEPILNAPAVVAWTIAALIAIHVARSFLSPDDDLQLLLYFAFIPARYDPSFQLSHAFPGGLAGDVWTFVTYSALHGDFMHVTVNSLWLLAFGSAVAWRFGGTRFLLFMAVTGACGAATHLLAHFGEPIPMIGASGAISGITAAAIRFVFEAGGPMGVFRRKGQAAFAVPALPMRDLFRSRQAVTFLIIWFGINSLYAISSFSVGEANSVAWEAHIGGFLAGLFLFPFFDPKPVVDPRDSQFAA